jgi:hypothetical protein
MPRSAKEAVSRHDDRRRWRLRRNCLPCSLCRQATASRRTGLAAPDVASAAAVRRSSDPAGEGGNTYGKREG